MPGVTRAAGDTHFSQEQPLLHEARILNSATSEWPMPNRREQGDAWGESPREATPLTQEITL
jgi:hypothetical protein